MRLVPADRVVLAAAALVLSAGGNARLVAQQGTWALTNARIQTVTRGVIERGTIVIRNGLIEAVGPQVTVPRDARVLDLAGRTVSPGLLDLTSTLGLPAPPAAQPGQGGGGGGGGAGNPPAGPRPGTQPEKSVLADLRIPPAEIRPLRDAGITAVLVAPARGLFRGQSALIPLRDSAGASEVVRAPVAAHIGYQGVQGDYPGTLLGVIAYQRQRLYDAQRHAILLDRWKQNPRGMTRPANDPSLEALVPVVRGQLPAFIEANNENEIRRAVRLAREFDLKLTVVGATEGFQAVDALQGATAVVSTSFPRPTDMTRWSYRISLRPPAGDSAAWARESERLAQGNAAALHQAGVRIALASGGVRPAEFLGNVRKAIAAGLPADAALQALTIRAAEIAGAGEVLGSVEPGKIANLVVSDGDLLAESARVREVFIDGIRYEAAPPPASGQSAGGAPGGVGAPAAQVGGTWAMVLNSPQGPLDITVTLTQSGASFSGTMTSQLGSQDVADGQISGRNVSWSTTLTIGGQSVTMSYRGEVDGNRMTGTADLGNFGNATFTAERRP
ncbi:MAG: amidohydrolase family protein [Gemmatimonadales bacterium]